MNFEYQSHAAPSDNSQPISWAPHRADAVTLARSEADSRKTHTWGLITGFAIISFFIAIAVATEASGQDDVEEDELAVVSEYDSIAFDERLASPTAQKKMKAALRNFVSTGQIDSILGTYFNKYIPGQMTALDADQHIGQIVRDLDLYLSRAEKSNRGGAYAKLASVTFSKMRPIAEGNFRPNARIAATSLISRLNDRALDSSAGRPPVPYAKALPVLVKLYLNEKNGDGVRAAALDGLHRHVMLNYPNIKGAGRIKLVEEMNKLLDAPAPERRSEQAHAYLQKYAVDILGVFQADKDPTLGMKLISISSKAEKPNLIALHSAASSGAMSGALAGKIENSQEIIHSWTKRTADAFADELNRFASMERRKPASSQPRAPKSFLQEKSDKKKRMRSMGGAATMGQGMMEAQRQMQEMQMQMSMGRGDGSMQSMMAQMEMSMQMQMGEFGGQSAEKKYKEQPPEVISSRRKLNHVLEQIHMGATGSATGVMPKQAADIGGLMVAAADVDKKIVEEWVTTIQDVIVQINEPALETQDKYLEELEAQLDVIRNLLPEEMREKEMMKPEMDGPPAIEDIFDLDDPFAELDG